MSFSKNRKTLTALATAFAVFVSAPALGQTADQGDGVEDSGPLKITIYRNYEKFDGVFTEGSGIDAPRIEGDPCPREQVLTCDVSRYFSGGEDRIRNIIADFAYEQRLRWHQKPDLGMLMGRTYVGLKDYIILAKLGIDPNLDPLWPWPRSTGMYGSLWDADTTDIGDRMAGPIMLVRRGPSQIEILGGSRKHFSGN